MYVECKSPSSFCTRGYLERFQNKVDPMHNTMDNKHEKNYLFANLCGHTTMDTYENNIITTKIYKLAIDFLHNLHLFHKPKKLTMGRVKKRQRNKERVLHN